MPVDGKYEKIYKHILEWHKNHCNPQTEEDWAKIAKDMSEFDNTQFERDLACAVVSELESAYHAQRANNA